MTMPALTATTRRADSRLQFSTEWLNSTVVRISVCGEVDASNSAEMLDYALRRGANCQRLILDLSEVTFFATAAFSVLGTLDVRSSQASVQWMVVPSTVVSRVLQICDPGRSLPRSD